MTREEARKILESGGSIKFKVWTFTEPMYECCECDSGCSCGDGFRDIEDALDTLFMFAAGEEDQLKEVK